MSDTAAGANDPATVQEQTGIVIYSKPGCCLCDDAKPLVAALAAEYGLPVYPVNILDDPELFAAYRYRIPVVRYAGIVLDEGRVAEAPLRAALRRLAAPAAAAARHAALR